MVGVVGGVVGGAVGGCVGSIVADAAIVRFTVCESPWLSVAENEQLPAACGATVKVAEGPANEAPLNAAMPEHPPALTVKTPEYATSEIATDCADAVGALNARFSGVTWRGP